VAVETVCVAQGPHAGNGNESRFLPGVIHVLGFTHRSTHSFIYTREPHADRYGISCERSRDIGIKKGWGGCCIFQNI